MKVENVVLYQVATDRNYKVGDKLKFGRKNNGQYYNVFGQSYQQDGVPLHKLGFISAQKGILKDKKILIELSKALQQYDFAFRELALEQVRKERFPKLPSRMKCMFLIDDKQACLNNLDIIANNAAKGLCQAVAVKLNGEVFYSKEFAIGRNGFSFNQYKEEAVKYWSQDQNSNEPTKEILFVGDAEIVEILKEIRIDKK